MSLFVLICILAAPSLVESVGHRSECGLVMESLMMRFSEACICGQKQLAYIFANFFSSKFLSNFDAEVFFCVVINAIV